MVKMFFGLLARTSDSDNKRIFVEGLGIRLLLDTCFYQENDQSL